MTNAIRQFFLRQFFLRDLGAISNSEDTRLKGFSLLLRAIQKSLWKNSRLT